MDEACQAIGTIVAHIERRAMMASLFDNEPVIEERLTFWRMKRLAAILRRGRIQRVILFGLGRFLSIDGDGYKAATTSAP